MDPIIQLSRDAEVKLTAWAIATGGYPGGLEFSGLGLIEKQGHILHVVDVDLLGVGSSGFTEFSPERAHMLKPDPRRKLWFHRHPISGWSGTDERTATKEPLGGIPEMVYWSCAIVLTPAGWIGRVDFHVPQTRTFHCAVEPKNPSQNVLAQAEQLITPQLQEYIEVLKAEYAAMHPAHRSYNEGYGYATQFEDGDFDVYGEEMSDYYCSECQCGLEWYEAEQLNALDVTTFICPNCGEWYVLLEVHSAIVIGEDNLKPKKQHPAWKKTGWWNRIRGGR